MDQELVTRLRRVIGRMGRHLNADATDEGLTPTQASVLGQIVARGPLGLRQLGELEGLNPTMLSRVIGKLDESGLITRKPDPDDARTAWVEGTARGAKSAERIRNRRTAALAECVARLSATDAGRLAAALPALEALEAELVRRR